MEILSGFRKHIGHSLFRLAVSAATVGGLAYVASRAVSEGWWDPGTVVPVALDEETTTHLRVTERPESWLVLAPIELGRAIPIQSGCFAVSGSVTSEWDQRAEFTLSCMRQLQRVDRLTFPRRYHVRKRSLFIEAA